MGLGGLVLVARWGWWVWCCLGFCLWVGWVGLFGRGWVCFGVWFGSFVFVGGVWWLGLCFDLWWFLGVTLWF